MNVIIKIKGREAIPIRALPLLAKWGTMNPDKIAGALGRVTDDDRRPLHDNLHDMNAFYVEDGTVHPVAEHHWRDHTYRRLKALSATIKHTEINHETGHSEWRVKALDVLPRDVFVWRDEYEPIYDREYGPGRWAHLSDELREGEKQTSREKLIASGCKPPVELNFNPLVDDDMQPIVQASIDAIRSAFDSESVSQVTLVDWHSVERVPLAPTMATAQNAAIPAPVVTCSEWVTLAQSRARGFIKQQRDRDLFPSQEAIGDQIAGEFRKDGIVGADGKPLSGATIKRHALKGISSATGKQLSTTIGQGK